MHESSDEPTTLACIVDAIPVAERTAHVALSRRLFGTAALEREDLPEGYAFRFEPAEIEAVARFVANERRCCPFLTFEITVAPGGSVRLRLSGPEGTRAFLKAELSSLGE